MSKANSIIMKMCDLIKSQKFDSLNLNFSQFRYMGNIESESDIYKIDNNPSISLYGDDVKNFNDLYFELYNE